MKRNKYYTFELYPNDDQKELLAKTFGSSRFVFNKMLEDFKKTGSILTPASYKAEFEFLKEVDSLALANSQMVLQQAIRNRKKNPKHFGFPNFKSKKNSRLSYKTNFVNGNIEIFDNHIKLPKLGLVKCKVHRSIPLDYTLKSCTIKKRPSGKYSASVLFEYESFIEDLELEKETTVALDFSMKSLYVDSNNNSPSDDFLRFYRKTEKRLSREIRKLSLRRNIALKAGKKLYESSNYQKQKIVVAKIHESISNKRKDFLHKESASITKMYNHIIVEDLNMFGMSKALNFGKSVHDNSWGSFLNMLEYKLNDKGGKLIKVDRFFPSSKMCSSCGNVKDDLSLSEREYSCTKCNVSIDRDYNAALNILNEGLRIK